MTIADMKLAVIKSELAYLIQNPQDLNDVAGFFLTGGFDNYSDDEIEQSYDLLSDYFKGL